jgi:hypothetical protein
VLLIGALITSYYLQIKRIRAVHETVVSIFAGELGRSIWFSFVPGLTACIGEVRNGGGPRHPAVSWTSDP